MGLSVLPSLSLIYHQSLSLVDTSHQHTNMLIVSRIFKSFFDPTSSSATTPFLCFPSEGSSKELSHPFPSFPYLPYTHGLVLCCQHDHRLVKSNELFTVLLLNSQQHCTWFSSVHFSHSVMSDSLRPHESQHTRSPCPSPTPGVYSNSCP